MFGILSAPFVRDKYIINSGDLCNCEIYLTELLNKSEKFKKQYGGEFIHVPKKKQNDGQVDAYNETYDLDFKLFIASTVMCGLSNYSESITMFTDAVIGKGPSKKKGNINASNIISIFIDSNLERLNNFEEKTKRCHDEENDIYQILKILRTEKNTLFFLPYYFVIGENESKNLDEFSNKLKSYFTVAWEYREQHVNKDTFFVTIYDKTFVIYSIRNYEWNLIDVINVRDISAFVKLCDFCDYERKYFLKK